MAIFTSIETLVQGHPWWSVGVAFAAGLVVGMLVRCCCACRRGCGNGAQRQRKPQQQAPSMQAMLPVDPGDVELYVGNLSYDTTEEGLRKEFERFGTVKSARIITNRFNNKSKGFGFVIMPVRKEAEAAVAAMNDRELQGRKLRVNEARNAKPQQE